MDEPAKLYFTEPCTECGHTVRYTKNRACVTCWRKRRTEYQRGWRARNPESAARASRADYMRRLERWLDDPEGGRNERRKAIGMPAPKRPEPDSCECCGRPPKKRAINLDHDHATGAFRGWLCTPCNVGIGLLGDSTEAVRKALQYLERSD